MTKRIDSPGRTARASSAAALLGPSEALGSRPAGAERREIAPIGAETGADVVSGASQSHSKALGGDPATDRSRALGGFGRREALVLAVAAGRECGVPADWILTRDRRGRVALARQLAMAAARRLGYSLPAIGEAFDRTHTTVLHADRAIAALALRDPRIAAALERIATAAAHELPAVAHEPVTPPPPVRPARRRPRRTRPPRRAPEFLGAYHTAHGGRRRLLLATVDGGRQLMDCAPGDMRLVQQFASGENLLQIAAVAREYLLRARDEGRPLVARRPQ
jgi:hypothetical protein